MELNDARRKRAVNMVWTAADRYDFEPQYLFFHGNGEPDLYLNTLEGLAYSCMDAGNPDTVSAWTGVRTRPG